MIDNNPYTADVTNKDDCLAACKAVLDEVRKILRVREGGSIIARAEEVMRTYDNNKNK